MAFLSALLLIAGVLLALSPGKAKPYLDQSGPQFPEASWKRFLSISAHSPLFEEPENIDLAVMTRFLST